MLSTNEVITVLQQHGFISLARSDPKVRRFEHIRWNEPLFVKQSSSPNPRLETPLVLHPRYEVLLTELSDIQGIERSSDYYHNSNLHGFPTHMHGGTTEIFYGIGLGFQYSSTLVALLRKLLGISIAPAKEFSRRIDPSCGSGSLLTHFIQKLSAPTILEFSPLANTVQLEKREHGTPLYLLENLAVTDTERESLRKARIGQSGYRAALIAYWGGCAVTGCSNMDMLRASHAKPWHAASPSERLDPFNGLLLVPNLDQAFDQGLISFDDEGQILISEALDAHTASLLGLSPHLRLRQIEPCHRKYLAWHRDYLFRM